MNFAMLCGAGGTGKSSICKVLEQMGDRYTIMRSSSRDTYKRLGIPTETAAFDMTIDEQKHLQDEIMVDHLDRIKLTIGEANSKARRMGAPHTIVIDRSPLDHMCYWVRTNALDVNSSIGSFTAQLGLVVESINQYRPEVIGFFDMPFPTPWETHDGMRDQNKIKTFEMSLMTTGMLHRYRSLFKARTFYTQLEYSSPQERALSIDYEMTRSLAQAHGVT